MSHDFTCDLLPVMLKRALPQFFPLLLAFPTPFHYLAPNFNADMRPSPHFSTTLHCAGSSCTSCRAEIASGGPKLLRGSAACDLSETGSFESSSTRSNAIVPALL